MIEALVKMKEKYDRERIKLQKELIERSGMSQAKLAEALDCSPAYISLLKSGKKIASLNMLSYLAGVLGCPLDVT